MHTLHTVISRHGWQQEHQTGHRTEEWRKVSAEPYLIAVGKDRVLIDVVNQILEGRPDAKADTKCQEVRRNDGIDDESACPPADPSACTHGI